MENLQLLHKIIHLFTYWRTYSELSSAILLNDVNITNENLSALILNKVYGWKLTNLNTSKTNFPAIDLGDVSNGIGISVTATDTSTYIKDKIAKNIKHKVYEKYPLHYFFITTKKKSYSTDFETKGKYVFGKDKNILDIEDVLKSVKEITDERILKDILNILEANVYKLKGRFIEDITPHDIAKVLEEFSTQNPSLIKNISASIQEIQRTAFPVKNKINNLSEGYIKLIQQESLPFFEQFANFLQQFENRYFKKIYYNITSDLQKIILVKRGDFERFDQIFETIEATCKEQVPNLLSDRRTLQILLHFMYFQCDIGMNKS
ncbi:MAG: SMEK domain-containing protein [Ignavibacteria bacterium]|nr:SMEK domain-containing protein [Ignavibacteria bacterium]